MAQTRQTRLPPDGQSIFALIALLALPLPPEDEIAESDAASKRQAEAAVALLRLGREDVVWAAAAPKLRQ
jgi:hypothetical protein